MQKILNGLWVFLLCVILTVVLFFHSACPLCLMQRLAMIGIATCALMNLKFGVKHQHYGLSLLFALLGHYIGIHMAPNGKIFLGLSLPTWSSIIFSGSLFAASILLIFFREEPPTWGKLEKLVYGYFIAVTVGLTIASI